jgi:Domain of unknown function (DUF4168)
MARIERRTLPQIFVPMLPDMSFLFDMPRLLIGWNCFPPDAVFVRRCVLVLTPFSVRAGAACKEAVMRVLMWPTAAALLIAVGLLSVPAANAQIQSPSPGLSDSSPNIPDQKLDAAAAAIERVASLKQDYQQRIAAAAPADKERILNEAVNALAKAVTDQGLSLEEYDSILEVAQNDPEIREKIRQRIRPSAK